MSARGGSHCALQTVEFSVGADSFRESCRGMNPLPQSTALPGDPYSKPLAKAKVATGLVNT